MAISPNTAWEADAAVGADTNGGGFVAGATGVDKTYGAGQLVPGLRRTDLAVSPIGTPAAPTASNATSGGTVAAATYYVIITYYGSGGETPASAQSSTTTTTGASTITVNAPAAAVGATAFKVYVATASGGPYYLQDGATGSTIAGGAFTMTATPVGSGANPPLADTSNVNVSSAALPFDATDVGNTIQVAAGTGWTTGSYQVVAVDAGGGKATLDRAPVAGGTANANAGTGTLGGALATYSKASRVAAGSNKVFLKYNAAAYTNFAQFGIGSNVTPGDGQSATAPPTRVIGYYQARGDIYPLAAGGYNNQASRPTVQASGGTVWVVAGNNGFIAENLVVDGGGQAASTGLFLGANSSARNCAAKNCTSSGINLGGNCAAIDCEVSGCTSAASSGVRCGAGSIVANCHVHDNACPGIYAGGGNAAIVDNLIVNNAGAGSDGVQLAANCLLLRNTIRGNGRHGAYAVLSSQYGQLYRDNVLANNGGYGLVGALAAGIAASPAMDGNAYYGNTSGARQYADDATVQPINGVAPYTNRLDVTCTASPFVSDTGTTTTSDFRLNATAGGGAGLKGTAAPRAWPLHVTGAGATEVTVTTSAPSFGAAQPAPVAGGSAGISKGRYLGEG